MSEELNLKEILKCTYQRKIIVITIIIISLIFGMLYTFLIKKPKLSKEIPFEFRFYGFAIYSSTIIDWNSRSGRAALLTLRK